MDSLYILRWTTYRRTHGTAARPNALFSLQLSLKGAPLVCGDGSDDAIVLFKSQCRHSINQLVGTGRRYGTITGLHCYWDVLFC